jgi:hypothetical protein
VLYLIDRDHMGKFGPDNRQAVQVLPLSTGIYSAAAYWNQHVYIFAADDVLKDFALQQGRLSQRPVSQGITRFIDPGATPTISANGSHSGVVCPALQRLVLARHPRGALRLRCRQRSAPALFERGEPPTRSCRPLPPLQHPDRGERPGLRRRKRRSRRLRPAAGRKPLAPATSRHPLSATMKFSPTPDPCFASKQPVNRTESAWSPR